MKKLTSWALIRQNLSRKPVRTGILAVIVFLFSFTLYCGTVIGQGLSQGTRTTAERLGADALFVPYGYDAKVQSSLLRGEPSSFYMDRRFSEEVRQEKGVEKVTAQLFIATLKASCCTLPVQLIGIDPETDFVVRPWMASAIDRPMRDDEVVVGSKIVGQVGDTLTLFGKELTIAARLEPTGMGFDTSVFLEIDRARRLLLASELGPRLNLPAGLDRNAFVSSTLIKAAPATDIKELVNRISQKYAAAYNLDFVVVAGMITDMAAKLSFFSRCIHVFSGVLWVLGALVMALVFSALIRERKKEFAVLRIIGASRSALGRIVMREALLVSLSGAFAGVAAAMLVTTLFNAYIGAVLDAPSLEPGPLYRLAAAAGALLLGLMTGPLACLPAMRKLGRIDAYIIMREEL